MEIAEKGDKRSLLKELILDPDSAAKNLQTQPPDEHLKDAYALASKHWEPLEQFGGMPALHQPGWDDTDRYEWLEDYSLAYLQRDLQDLAKSDRLEPFVRAQKIAALRTAQPF